MIKTPAQQTMERESRITFGRVPHSLFGADLDEASWQLVGDQFLLRGEGQHYFHYRKGLGVTIERGTGADISEESLWLNGSVYAAIASFNGLLPIHASAIAHGGQVFAFSGPSSAGKSTLIAALGDSGFPMFCDDTLLLDLTNADRIVCLPGHKKLKLTPAALELTGAEAGEKVSATVGKYFSKPGAGVIGHPLPLGQLIILESGDELSITPVVGGEKLLHLHDDHQFGQLYASARRYNRADLFRHFAALAPRIDMWRFQRPMVASRFQDGVTLVLNHLVRSNEG